MKNHSLCLLFAETSHPSCGEKVNKMQWAMKLNGIVFKEEK